MLLIAGSGAVDRDENLPQMRLDVLRQLAVQLASIGIASLRYDKRGVGQSGGDFLRAGFLDNVADAACALEALRHHAAIIPSQIMLLGHSEGAVIAVKLGGDGADVAGLVLLGCPAQQGEQVLAWQSARVAEGLTGINRWIVKLLRIDVPARQRRLLERIKRSTDDVMRSPRGGMLNAKWFREFMAYDPIDSFVRLRVPVLAITGAKDIQVDPADLTRMAVHARTDFTDHIVPDVNHILRYEPGRPSTSHYVQQVADPIDPRVVALILTWARARLRCPSLV
jgi:pimeloyl-ACP methyl ester carboxylesterase